METYKKPTITGENSSQGAFPFYAAVGMAMALRKGKSLIDSTHTQVLTPRKDFSE